MADPFGFIGDTLQSAFIPDTEDEEARKYREEYERMRRTLQAQGKPAPPPIYQTRKPENIFGGLFPEMGAGTLARKRRGERDAWRRSYDPIAMKRFQDQRRRDELQRDIARRRQLERRGSQVGQTPTLNPSFTGAAKEGGWSPAELSVLAKRNAPAFQARTEDQESELERLMFEQAGGISATAGAKQARARTPSVESEQKYVKNYWDAMTEGRVWNSAWQRQQAENEFAVTYSKIKGNIEEETEQDRILLSRVAAIYAGLKRKAYEQSPQVHIDAITGTASKIATEAAEFDDPASAALRARTRDAKTAAMEVSEIKNQDFITWFNKQDKRRPPGFLTEQQWRKVEEMIKRYGQSSGTSNEDFQAAINAIANAMGQTGSGGGAGGSWGPGSLTPPVPSHIPTE